MGTEAYLNGRYEEAVSHFEREIPYVGVLDRYMLARSYMELGRWKQAETWLRTLFWADHSIVHFHLGRVYDELGEPAKARQAYEDFTIAWKNADPALQPLVEDARTQMARLGDFPSE